MPEDNCILVGSMNPSIDVTMGVDRLRAGGTNRARFVREDAGGKGINVARALKALGVRRVRCAGLIWRSGSEILTDALERAGVEPDFLFLEGATRRNIKVLDEEKEEITEINARSEAVSEDTVRAAGAKLVEGARHARFLVLTGSLPTGCPADFYERVIRESGAACALDADGDALAAGIRARPFVLKCNEKELCTAAQGANALERVRAALDAGVSIVLASMGAQGSLLASAGGAWRAEPLRLRVRSTVGAGDAMLSGLLAALARGAQLEDAFVSAVACASASVEGDGTFIPDADCEARYRPYVKINRVMEW